jgi:hypothetical protein
LELGSDHFPSGLCQAVGIIKDPAVWLDGARPPPKYIFKKDRSTKNSNIWPTRTLD